MQKKTLLILLIALLLAPTLATETNPKPGKPVQAVELKVPKPTFQDKWKKLTYEEKVEWNPNKCDLTTEILWNSDGTCHKKPVQAVVSPPKPPSGDWVTNCHKWAKQAGIVLNSAAIKLIERESHCNPVAWNASSGAGGIPQALPFSKTGCELSVAGAVCQLKWMQTYVVARYGSWESALAHSYSHNWY